MESKRVYKRRGTPDLPIGTYIAIAGKNMYTHEIADYHPEMEILLAVSGNTTEEIGGNIHTYSPGDIWIVPGNVAHRRLDFSADAKVHCVVFSAKAIAMQPGHFFQDEFVTPLAEGRLEMPALLQPGHPAYTQVHDLLMELEKCRIFETNYRQQRFRILVGICLALMPYCAVIADETPISDPGHEGVKLCKRYLHNNHQKKITLNELSEHCHLHPNYLCAVFKQYVGESIFEYLSRIRVESAQRLLMEGLPVSMVAELSGFHSERLLYRKFKEQTGMTPLTCRKQQSQKKD